MFKWIHLIDSVASLIRQVCRAICNVFGCTEHSKNESEEK